MVNKSLCQEYQGSKGNGNLKGLRMFFVVMMLAGQITLAPAQNPARVSNLFGSQLVRVFEYRDRLDGAHPFVKDLYPIAIAKDGYFYVFDLDSARTTYSLKTFEKTGMEVPEGVRAAFPLHFYDEKCACIVTGDVFDTPEGYVTIFHEFIHCKQWHTVEPQLRSKLPLAIKQTEEENYMWEMDYPFPYQDVWFTENYSDFIAALDSEDWVKAMEIRKEIVSLLNEDDHQYMVWQEWKEGFALYVENKMRRTLDLPANKVGRGAPYSRLVFYAGGEAFIKMLVTENPELNTDMEGLFRQMYSL